MRYTLKDYQAGAVGDVLQNLDRARDSYHRHASAIAATPVASTT